MKIILSTGLGRLHLVQSVESLVSIGVDIEIIQGWIPRLMPDIFINLIGYIVGSKNLSSGMKKRRMDKVLSVKFIHSCTMADFFCQGLFMLSKFKFFNQSFASRLGWIYFGYSSKKFIEEGDIFHVRSGAGQGGAIKKAKKMGMKVIVDHSIAHPDFLNHALNLDFQKYGLPNPPSAINPFWSLVIDDCNNADLLLVNSNFVKETFIEKGYPPDKIRVIYTGVRADFCNLKINYEANQRLELLFTGEFGIRKGAQYLIPAVEELVSEGYDIRLTVVGIFDEVRSLVNNSSLQDRLNCIGHIPQDHLKSFLAKSDIYIFPSLAEGCASSGMEAMAAGLPVIATLESGLPIIDGIDGLIIESKSIQAIKQSIIRLSQDKILRESLGRFATKKIVTSFTWRRYAIEVNELYENVSMKLSKAIKINHIN